MWNAPATTAALLAHVVQGAEAAGYTGLMVALLRTADAAAQLTELSEEWTSMHDVTGQLIAVLSPDPTLRSGTGRFAARPGTNSLYGCAAMHDLRLLSAYHRDFDLRFASSVARDRTWGRPSARPGRTPREHRYPWTEAASRCASYFGIAEAQLPSILLMSFPERTAVLVQLRPRSAVSLYDLCKHIAENLGCTKRAAEVAVRRRGLRQRREHLQGVVDRAEMPYGRWWSRLPALLGDDLGRHLTDELRAQYVGLDQHLRQVEDIDPALVGRWRERLSRVLSEGTVEQIYRQLFAIRAAVNGPSDRQKWRRLGAKVGKVIRKTNHAILGAEEHFWQLDEADPIAVALQRAESEKARWQAERDEAVARAGAEIRHIDDELRWIAEELAGLQAGKNAESGLTAAAVAAVRDMLVRADAEVVSGRGGLAGYTVQVIRPVGMLPENPQAQSGNSLTGTVLGSVLQARDITGDVHIHQHRAGWWTRLRRRCR